MPQTKYNLIFVVADVPLEDESEKELLLLGFIKKKYQLISQNKLVRSHLKSMVLV